MGQGCLTRGVNAEQGTLRNGGALLWGRPPSRALWERSHRYTDSSPERSQDRNVKRGQETRGRRPQGVYVTPSLPRGLFAVPGLLPTGLSDPGLG